MKYLLVVFISVVLGLSFFIAGKSMDLFPEVPSVSEKSNQPSSLSVIAKHLDTPWAIVFLPDQSFLVTERPGRVRLINKDGVLESDPATTLPNVKEYGEGGLLGITIHPNFAKNKFVYLYYTYSTDGNNTLNRVVRMTYEDKKLKDEKIIVDSIPGAIFHNGGRIKFGPDKNLYITTGDARNDSIAQDTRSLGGKILRVNDTGKAVQDNPFNNLVYSFGHRNPQGIAWDKDGTLWATEHGRSLPSGFDEVNLIEKGKNYGWPVIQGDEIRTGMVVPKKQSGANITWAPSGAAFAGNSFFFAGLKGEALYEAKIKDKQVVEFREHLKGEFGRLREVVLGPDNMLYITTSNKDGRGNPGESDDRIIKVNPEKL